MKRIVLLFICFQMFLLPSAWSQTGGDIAGSADHALMPRFWGSHIAGYQVIENTVYRLALGRMQSVSGRVSAGREERLQGKLSRITYRMPAGVNGLEVFGDFSSRMLNMGRELYRCQGRGCGSSNFWANDVFENRILYGPETDQFYLASSVINAEGQITAYVAVYVITRGNRSVYAHLDILELPAVQPVIAEAGAELPDAADLLLQLRERRSVILQGLSFDAQDQLTDASGLEAVITMLRAEPQLQVYVVAHLHQAGELEALLERSLFRATVLHDRIDQAGGVETVQVIPQGVGPLVPACEQRPCEERIELVLQP